MPHRPRIWLLTLTAAAGVYAVLLVVFMRQHAVIPPRESRGIVPNMAPLIEHTYRSGRVTTTLTSMSTTSMFNVSMPNKNDAVAAISAKASRDITPNRTPIDHIYRQGRVTAALTSSTSMINQSETYNDVAVEVTHTLFSNQTLQHHSKRTSLNISKYNGSSGFNSFSDCFLSTSSINRTARQNVLKDTFECRHLMTLKYVNYGRTGNQMFQVASLLGTASYHGYTAVIDSSMEIAALFDLPNVYEETKLILNENTTKYVWEEGCCIYSERIQNISHNTNWTLGLSLQSWRYFEGKENIVRQAFTMKDNLTREARNFIKSKATLNTTTISIHVRRGDFTNLYFTTKGYIAAPIEYIQNAMEYFRKRYERVHFFAISDDKTWCEDNLRWANVTISPFSTVGHDMALMAESDHVIMTSGTFGWWGAWLSGGVSVYWTGFPIKGTWLGNQTVLDDFYPRHWIGLS